MAGGEEIAWRATATILSLVLVAALNQGTIRNMADDAQAEFDAAFAQAAVKQPKVIDPEAPLPHYPQQRYIDKNLAPEKNLTYGDVSELANARRVAESTGVIPKELGEYMLPMAMVEGRSGNFGINGDNAFRATPATLARAKTLGLGITDFTDPATVERHKYDFGEEERDATGNVTGRFNYYRRITVQGPNGPMEAHQVVEGPTLAPLQIDYAKKKNKTPLQALTAGMTAQAYRDSLDQYEPKIPGNKMLQVNGTGDPGAMAKIMALILAEKHAAAKGDIAGAVKGYNGSGPATEKYWAKVQAAKKLLANPKNAPLMSYYNSVYLKKGQ